MGPSFLVPDRGRACNSLQSRSIVYPDFSKQVGDSPIIVGSINPHLYLIRYKPPFHIRLTMAHLHISITTVTAGINHNRSVNIPGTVHLSPERNSSLRNIFLSV